MLKAGKKYMFIKDFTNPPDYAPAEYKRGDIVIVKNDSGKAFAPITFGDNEGNPREIEKYIVLYTDFLKDKAREIRIPGLSL